MTVFYAPVPQKTGISFPTLSFCTGMRGTLLHLQVPVNIIHPYAILDAFKSQLHVPSFIEIIIWPCSLELINLTYHPWYIVFLSQQISDQYFFSLPFQRNEHLHTARKLFKTEFAKVILRGNKKYFPLKES
jgi:hypothetical protein